MANVLKKSKVSLVDPAKNWEAVNQVFQERFPEPQTCLLLFRRHRFPPGARPVAPGWNALPTSTKLTILLALLVSSSPACRPAGFVLPDLDPRPRHRFREPDR